MTEVCDDGYCARAQAVEAVEEALAPLTDSERAQAMSAYMRGRFEFLGIGSEPRRDATREILRRRPLDLDFVRGLWELPEREFQYVAVDHLRRQRRFPAALLPVLADLVTTKSWWDTVDHLAKVAGVSLRYDAAGTAGTAGATAAAEIIDDWETTDNFWLRRVAIICQLGFGTDTDTVRLARAIEANLAGSPFRDEFFINKAIGWALRDYARHNPNWVRDFVDSHDLVGLSRREALKHL